MPSLRERQRAAAALWDAIFACDPRDAAFLMAAALEEMGAGPNVASFELDGEAALWAASAPPHLLVTYARAALRELRRSPLSRAQRGAIATEMMVELNDTECRAAFRRARATALERAMRRA